MQIKGEEKSAPFIYIIRIVIGRTLSWIECEARFSLFLIGRLLGELTKNSTIIKQVLANNSYLLKKHNLTQKYQIEQLRIQGIKISRSGISRYRRGIYKTCALTYLHIFAEFWSVPLTTMILCDFENNAQ